MTGEPALELGDRVRIRVGPVTETAGFAGRIGQVYGWTTPSLGYVDEVVVGDPLDDVAVNVNFGDESAWFATDQIEFMDHGPGTTIGIGDKEFVRLADGTWQQMEIEHEGGLMRRLARWRPGRGKR